uniref:Uncharacterized protein n=1 Tax=Oryza meridionalis TaxID=40149 RepID=A0A0E0F0X5_9ORYZ
MPEQGSPPPKTAQPPRPRPLHRQTNPSQNLGGGQRWRGSGVARPPPCHNRASPVEGVGRRRSRGGGGEGVERKGGSTRTRTFQPSDLFEISASFIKLFRVGSGLFHPCSTVGDAVECRWRVATMGGGNSADFFSATASFVFSRGFFSRAATPLRTPLTRQGIPAMKQSSGDGRLLLRLWLQLLNIRQCDVYGPDGAK